jgi:two-component system, LytTR family, response regulator
MQTLKKQYFKQLDNEIFDTEIVYLQAKINYTIVHFANGLVKKSGYTLKRFEELLNEKNMYKRIHRTFMVNMNFVETVDIESKKVKIKNGPTLIISRRKMVKLWSYFMALEA